MEKNTANMLGSVGGSVVSAGLGMLDSYLSRRYNERMIDKQNAWNLAQWNRENAYNHPSAVTARMKQAGINPALAYMNGASFAPAATSPQSDASQALSFGMQMDPMTVANLRLLESQAQKNESEARATDATLPKIEQEVEVAKKQVEDYQRRWSLMSSEEQLNKAKSLDIQFQQMMSEKNYRISLRTLENQIRATEQDIKESESREKINLVNGEYLVKTLALRCLGVDLQNKEILSRIGLNSSLVRKADAEATLLGFDVNARTPQDLANQIYNKRNIMEQDGQSVFRNATSAVTEAVMRACNRILDISPLRLLGR